MNKYQIPSLSVLAFDVEDVITASTVVPGTTPDYEGKTELYTETTTDPVTETVTEEPGEPGTKIDIPTIPDIDVTDYSIIDNLD